MALPPSPAPAAHPEDATVQEPGQRSPGPSARLLPRLIRAEANLLRLPLFALQTKGLRSLDGIECRGTITRDGQTHTFTLRATRNTATLYPGPLARAAHLAFLSIATDQSLPLANPIAWTWRDLCRRMEIVYSGQAVRDLKKAIRSTALLGIRSEYAIYAKAERQLLRTQEEYLHLYERVTFVGAELPDGRLADRNYLWFADWYLQNLNALFTAPLDYGLWRHLNKRSPIASRLYEFLLLNFYGGAPLLRINYPNLAQFLPVRPERFLSLAKVQMDPALTLLRSLGIIAEAKWGSSKGGVIQLIFHPGQRLTAAADARQPLLPLLDLEGSLTDDLAVKELRNLQLPEADLVIAFYRLWTGQEQIRPTKKELAQAAELLTAHGRKKAHALLPLLIGRMREKWPDAKSFGSIHKYLPDILEEWEHRQRTEERQQEECRRAQQEREAATRRTEEQAALKAAWLTLPAAEQEEIRRTVLVHQPRRLEKFPAIIESFCLQELARRRGTTGSNPQPPLS